MMKTTLGIAVIMIVLLTGCSSAAANTQAQADLERQRQLTAQAEADSQAQADMMTMLQQQALANQQAQAAAANAQAQASAALAQAGQAQAAALNAVATVAGDGVRIPTNVALTAIIALIIVVIARLMLGVFNRPVAPLPPRAQTVRLLPRRDDPQFNRLLADKGGYWRQDTAYDADGSRVIALLDIVEETEWTQ